MISGIVRPIGRRQIGMVISVRLRRDGVAIHKVMWPDESYDEYEEKELEPVDGQLWEKMLAAKAVYEAACRPEVA